MTFISEEDFKKGGEELRKSWFKLYSSLEAIDKFHDPLDKEYEKYLAELISSVEEEKKLLTLVSDSAMKLFKGKMQEFGSLSAPLKHALVELEKSLKDNLNSLKRYSETLPQVEKVEKELDMKRKKLAELKMLKDKICSEYEEKQEIYRNKTKNIRDVTSNKLIKIRDEFIDEIEDIFEGYELLDESGKKLSFDILFQNLIKDPEYYKKVTISSKGFFKRKSDLAARNIVLKYRAEAAKEKIIPLLEEEKRKTADLAQEKRLMEELKRKCNEMKVEIGETAKVKDRLEKESKDFKKIIETHGRMFSDYRAMLEIRANFLDMLENVRKYWKKLFDLIEDSIKDYTPEEKDTEKRELRVSLKNMRQSIRERDEAIRRLRAEVENAGKSIEILKKEKEEFESRVKSLEKVKVERENEIEVFENQVSNLKSKLEKRISEISQLLSVKKELTSKLEESVRIAEGLEVKENKLEEELEMLRRELEDRDNRIKDLEGVKTELENERKGQIERIKVLEAEDSSLKDKVRVFKDSIIEEDKKRRELESKLKKLEEEIEIKERDIAIAEKDIDDLKLKTKKLIDENRKFHGRISAFEERSASREEEILSLMEELNIKEVEFRDIRQEIKDLENEKDKSLKEAEKKIKELEAEIKKLETSKKKEKTKKVKKKESSKEEARVGEKLKNLRDRRIE